MKENERWSYEKGTKQGVEAGKGVKLGQNEEWLLEGSDGMKKEVG